MSKHDEPSLKESDIDVLVLLHREEDGDREWLINAAVSLSLKHDHCP